MAFKMTSEKHGEVRVIREDNDSLVLIFGDRFEYHGSNWVNALTEREGYTELPNEYVIANTRRLLHDEHVDKARSMRDRLDLDTAFLGWLEVEADHADR